ncbi:MAG: ethanolamine utilization microcompartment protein EutL [Deltaproteobacteria bacterium]|nr:ethanolamine utilization microcompartment protein EutL [Deltaproteobacteria bacterium]
MTLLKRTPATLLACRRLPHADARLCEALGLPAGAAGRSLALVTCDQDDALYAALDHATKIAAVDVLYARSFYAGSAHASGPHSGEALGVLSADEPESVEHGVQAVEFALRELFAFYAVGDTGVSLFPAAIGSVGRYLSREAGVPPGTPFGYFIAPPVEALVGVDAALKAADVALARFFGPPTETNFAGAYVTGSLDAVEAAARAFTDAVVSVAQDPSPRRAAPSRPTRGW